MPPPGAGSRSALAGALLRLAHDTPGLTRARAAQELGLSTGTATQLVARLAEAHLLDERPAPPTGAPGRPTRQLVAHAAGPVVIGAVIDHRGWRMRAVELGGAVLAETDARHADPADGPGVVRAVATAAARFADRWPGRVRGVGLGVPGPVRDGQVVNATLLGWRQLDLRRAWHGVDGAGPAGSPTDAPLLVAANDATLAATGEARRGAARGASTHLHLRLEIGIGGAVTAGARALEGARGAAGEFGHLPFGDPAVPCPCGASGCWERALDGMALARMLAAPAPADPVRYTRHVLDQAAAGHARPLAAVEHVARSLGRGVAGLVNALDPDLVTLGGLAPRLLDVAPGAMHRAYLAGLMAYRRADPPPLVPAALRDAASLVGATERVWDDVMHRL